MKHCRDDGNAAPPTKNCPLAIFTPLLGRQTHTFVKAHIERILPGRTVVVAVVAFEPTGPRWTVDAPVLFIPPRLQPSEFQQDSKLTMFQSIPAEHRRRFSTAEHTRCIEAFLREHEVQVILAQWLDTHLPLVDMARDLGMRYFCQTHGSDITAGLREANTRRAYTAYNRIDGVIAPSEFGRQQLLRLGLKPELVRVLRVMPCTCRRNP